MKKSQNQRIIEILERDGEISRNQCLSMYLSRLASRINDLEHMGWRFTAFKRDNDYVYRVVSAPKAKQLELQLV